MGPPKAILLATLIRLPLANHCGKPVLKFRLVLGKWLNHSGRSTAHVVCTRARAVQLQGRPPICADDGRLGHRRHDRRGVDCRTTRVACPQFRYSVANLRTPPPTAYERCDLRVWRLCADGKRVLCRTTHVPGSVVFGWPRGI